jgi:hypothetical protein
MKAAMGVMYELGSPAILFGGKTFTGWEIFDKMRANRMFRENFTNGALGAGGQTGKQITEDLAIMWSDPDEKRRNKAAKRFFGRTLENVAIQFSGVPGALQYKRGLDFLQSGKGEDFQKLIVHPSFLNIRPGSRKKKK